MLALFDVSSGREIAIIAAVLTAIVVVCSGNGCFARFKDGRMVQEGDCEDFDDHPIFRELEARVEMKNNNLLDFNFSRPDSVDFVQYLRNIPELNEFTICAWVSPNSSNQKVSGSLASYCVTGQLYCNTLWIKILTSEKAVVVLDNRNSEFAYDEEINFRSHICIVMSIVTGNLHFYLNATEQGMALKSAKRIPSGGVLILGQDQDGAVKGTTPGMPMHSQDGFRGLIEDFSLWNRAFSISEIRSLHGSPCYQQNDAIVSFNSTNAKLFGHVTATKKAGCAGK